MNDIVRVISQLEQQRATIDHALAALREIEGLPVTASPRGFAQPNKKQVSFRGSEAEMTPQFTGNKAEFIGALIKSRPSSGINPREIAEVFTARRIKRSKGLIRNTSYKLLNGKQLKREGERYFLTSRRASATSVPQKKRRISPEGVKRIIANKMWAAKRAGPIQGGNVPANRGARTAV